MLKSLKELWIDEQGFIVSIELILIATIGVLGLIVGLSCLSNAIVAEYQDLGWAVRGLNQSYYFGGFRGCKAWVPGSSFTNRSNLAAGSVNDNWDLGYGANLGPSYAAPTYVAPAVVVPQGPVLIPCPTGDCPKVGTVPCPSGDCATGKVVPGTPLQPHPDHTLPKSTPIPAAPQWLPPQPTQPSLPPLQ